MSKDLKEEAAARAVVRAKAVHQEAVDQSGEIAILSARVRTLRETNHFADLIRSAFTDGEARR